MARPISPTGVRRLADGSPVEARTKMGVWLPITDLTTGSLTRVNEFWQQHGDSAMFPMEAFCIEVHDDQFDGDQPNGDAPTSSTPVTVTDAPTDGQSAATTPAMTSTDAANLAGQFGAPTAAPSIEDIVRRIAGDLDGQVMEHIEGVEAIIYEYINSALDDPARNSGVGPIQRIELIKPDEPVLAADGLFHHQFNELVFNTQLGHHSYLPGPPGTGKTHSAKQVADLLGWKFGMLTCGPQTSESAFYGGMDAHGRFHETPLVKCLRHAIEHPESGSIFLCDELDNGNPSVFTTLNTLLANGGFQTREGEFLEVGKNFVVIGTANTFGTGPTKEFSGRNKMDSAFLDRFAYIPWPTDERIEEALVRAYIANRTTADLFVAQWRAMRASVEERNIKFFVTMRGAMMAAKMIAAGATIQRALMLVAGNKLPADQWDQIKPAVMQ